MVNQIKTAKVVYDLSTYSLLVFLVCAFVTLSVASIIVRDVTFPKKHPIKFTIETLLMAFVATIPFMFIVWSRTGSLGVSDLTDFIVLIIKFTGLHILFQFSGIYTLLFKTSGTSVLL